MGSQFWYPIFGSDLDTSTADYYGQIGAIVRHLLDAVSWDARAPIDNLIRSLSPSDKELIETLTQRVTGMRNRVYDVISNERPSDGTLEIISGDQVNFGQIDVKLRNISSDTAFVTALRLVIIHDDGFPPQGVIEASATYEVSTRALVVGDSTRVGISLGIPPHDVDRYTILIDDFIKSFRLTLEYNGQYEVSRNVWMHYRYPAPGTT